MWKWKLIFIKDWFRMLNPLGHHSIGSHYLSIACSNYPVIKVFMPLASGPLSVFVMCTSMDWFASEKHATQWEVALLRTSSGIPNPHLPIRAHVHCALVMWGRNRGLGVLYIVDAPHGTRRLLENRRIHRLASTQSRAGHVTGSRGHHVTVLSRDRARDLITWPVSQVLSAEYLRNRA